jgi:hypothetical protein
MKLLLFVLLLTGFCACQSSSEEPGPVSTVDSSVVDPPDDTISPLLYLDSQMHDSSFDIALDSSGPMVTAEDTSYRRN